MAKKIIATYPILYESKMYEKGEPLPTNNHEMTKIWLDSGTAEWQDVNENIDSIKTNEKSEELKSQALGDIDNKDDDKVDNSESNIDSNVGDNEINEEETESKSKKK